MEGGTKKTGVDGQVKGVPLENEGGGGFFHKKIGMKQGKPDLNAVE